MFWPKDPHDCAKHGHRFEARYDTVPPSMNIKQNSASSKEVVRIVDAMTTRTYIHDICVRCGQVVQRSHE